MSTAHTSLTRLQEAVAERIAAHPAVGEFGISVLVENRTSFATSIGQEIATAAPQSRAATVIHVGQPLPAEPPVQGQRGLEMEAALAVRAIQKPALAQDPLRVVDLLCWLYDWLVHWDLPAIDGLGDSRLAVLGAPIEPFLSFDEGSLVTDEIGYQITFRVPIYIAPYFTT